MAKRALVHCRFCHGEIDRDDKDISWVMPTKNFYYHQNCYNDYVKKKKRGEGTLDSELDANVWFDMIYDMMVKEYHATLDMQKTTSQWKNFLNKGKYTPKGMFFALKYYFTIAHGDPTKSDGIGIIPFIYEDSGRYWVQKNAKDIEVRKKIEEQIAVAQDKKTRIVRQDKTARKKRAVSFSEIGED